MKKNRYLNIDKIDTFIFDFDGVLTNNKVYISQNGNESVRCCRSDGLAFDVIKKLKKRVLILSTEKNKVVEARSRKLQVEVFHAVNDKKKALLSLEKKNNMNLSRVFYVGNDLNDYYEIKICGYSACPSDSHTDIKKIVNFKLLTKGGEGVVREIIEKIFAINIIQTLYDVNNMEEY